ncbi:MAG: hypothetical protein PHG44_05765 [Lentisphaeria bacterium]|nr:hypothetical protein [Lentisphaeria bacterium]MDY0175279.1 hypothetical protein [Lentisphaeria bacterium]
MLLRIISLSLLLPLFIMADSTLKSRLEPYCKPEYWQGLEQVAKFERQHLVTAIEAARVYYLNQQYQSGNFLYAMNLSSGELFEDDNQVRQAGALWALSCLNRDRFTENTRRAVLAGIDFFERNQKKSPSGEQVLAYPGEELLKTGTVALFCLSLIEFLRGQKEFLPPEVYQRYDDLLEQQLTFLQSMEMAGGSWAWQYDLHSGYREKISSPYYDGEALLAYCKAARYLGRKKLLPRIKAALPQLIEKYTVESWAAGGDREQTKGFYQWACMAFAEIVEAGWDDAGIAAEGAMALTWWQIYDNKVESREGNTAYAVEGLIAAWRIAKLRQDEKSMATIRQVIDNCLGRLMLLQVGGPFQKMNPYLTGLPRVHPKAYGGISAGPYSNIIRIDNVQHQLNAMLLAVKYLY